MNGQKNHKHTASFNYDLTDMAGEIWKDVDGYEGIYMVSNKGRVKSLERRVWNYTKRSRILHPVDNGHSYLSVSMSGENGKRQKHVYIHILVAKAFIPNPRKCEQVNHKDFDKANNCVENLEWVTSKENKLHYRESAYCRRVEENKDIKLLHKTAKRLKELRDPVLTRYASGMSVEDIHNELSGVGVETIRLIIELFDGWGLGTKFDDRL